MYNRRMRGLEHPGRPIYERIKNLQPKCPLCGIGRVRQVDHHLPKSRYPYLAVAPVNLVPVCGDCNFVKLDQIPASKEEQTLHPYFDNVEDERWLRAEFLIHKPDNGDAGTVDWQVRFFVDPPDVWDPQLGARIIHHFNVFHLAEVYEAQVADELDTLGFMLETVFDGGGCEDVRAHLLDVAHQRTRPRQNNWMTALYEALAASDWYCSGGFTLVAAG
ncbi:hypothetical protein F7Q99_36950 [Streptomyces kaniharaensis]|uniref:HNH endonuclease n=2 Tax=Streptomyces kaniharaensis TaxID=212423 RepID=A0A6N7L202_9ACTN|nr:hypothetical protein [Streptomyces kaniharaensis]